MVEADFQRFYRLDLRVEVDRTSVRRLAALLHGLPPDAATWRKDRLPPGEEFLALLAERSDEWSRVALEWRSGKKVRLPPPLRIERPGHEEPVLEPRQVENDPTRIAAWFGMHVAG